MDKSRLSSSLNVVNGILVTYMVLMHAQQNAQVTETFFYYYGSIVFSFFMTWFYFKSGMFYKEENTKILLKKTMFKYLGPFVFYVIIGELFFFLKEVVMHGSYDISSITKLPLYIIFKGSTPGNAPLWFLLSIFVVRNVFNYIYCRITKNKVWLLPIFIVVSLITTYVLADLAFVPWLLKNILLGLLFYYLGYLFREIQFHNQLFIVSIIVSLLFFLIRPSLVSFWNCETIYGNSAFWILGSITGNMVINNLIYRLPTRNSLFAYIGHHSMTLYCLHWIVFNIVGMILYKAEFEGLAYFLLLLLLSIVIFIIYLLCIDVLKSKYKLANMIL